jgi:hypothetical protein
MNGWFVSGLSVLVMAAIGCGPGVDSVVVPPRPKVNLPDTPSLVLPEVVAKHPDGTWTVAGIRAEGLEGRWESPVEVRGVVLDRKVCPMKRRRNQDPCVIAPHLTLGVSLSDPSEALLITGTNAQIHALPEMGVVCVVGAHQQWSEDHFFVDSRGLIQLPVPEDPEAPMVLQACGAVPN